VEGRTAEEVGMGSLALAAGTIPEEEVRMACPSSHVEGNLAAHLDQNADLVVGNHKGTAADPGIVGDLALAPAD